MALIPLAVGDMNTRSSRPWTGSGSCSYASGTGLLVNFILLKISQSTLALEAVTGLDGLESGKS